LDLNKKISSIDAILILLLLALVILFIYPNNTPSVVEHEAQVELYQFNDLYGGDTLSVELWLKNIGDKTAYNLSIYIRCRNQNGMILYNNTIKPTSLFLRSNETCTATYTLILDNTTYRIYHTIEITWDTGRKTYSEFTNIPITFEDTNLKITIGG